MTVLRKLRRYYRPFYGAVLSGTAITMFVLLVLQGLPFFARAELNAYDFQLARRGTLATPQDIRFVGIDQATIGFLNNGSYPLKRESIAAAIEKLCPAHPKAIGIDLIFPTATQYDAAVARAMRACGNVVVADNLALPASNNNVQASLELVEPVAAIALAAARVGLANVPTDADGKIRAIDFEQLGPGGSTIGGKQFPSFSVQVASLALHKPIADVERGLPHHMLINYIGSQNPGDASQQRFLTDELVSLVVDDTPSDVRHLYANKIVVIGCAAIVCNDTKQSPYGDMFGPIVEANAINTLLNRNPIIPAGDGANNLAVLFMGLLTLLAASRFGLLRSMATTLLLAVSYVVLTFVLFDGYRIWINTVTPETNLVLVFAAVMALRFATVERQRKRTSQKFGLYVKPEIVEMLMNASDEEKALDGGRRPISVLFVDVRGFTAMSELMEPEDVVRTLDIYLEELTISVQEHDGTVDKYVGDELMAIWNAPRYQRDHPLLAVRAALDMVRRMDGINLQLTTQGLPSIAYGIGVNSGDAVVGEMGSSFRKQYDVIGDTVNTGARLCSAAGRGEIIIGEATWEMIGKQLVVEETEPLRLKGKRQPLRTFRVIAESAEGQTTQHTAAAPA